MPKNNASSSPHTTNTANNSILKFDFDWFLTWDFVYINKRFNWKLRISSLLKVVTQSLVSAPLRETILSVFSWIFYLCKQNSTSKISWVGWKKNKPNWHYSKYISMHWLGYKSKITRLSRIIKIQIFSSRTENRHGYFYWNHWMIVFLCMSPELLGSWICLEFTDQITSMSFSQGKNFIWLLFKT